jgi:hypothetical protein
VEPRKDESQKPAQPRKEEKQPKRRFQIVKLEERIAPHLGNTRHCGCSNARTGCPG